MQKQRIILPIKFRAAMSVLLGLSLLGLCQQSYADIASTFDNDLDGWVLEGGADHVHQLAGGNPGGFLRVWDWAPTMDFVAPAKFLGDLSSYDGQTLSFDAVDQEQPSTVLPDFGTITISGPAGAASIDVVPNGVSGWDTYATSLTASDWGVSQVIWDGILLDVTRLSIDLSAQSSLVDIGIDNIRVECTSIPEPSTTPLLLSALLLMCSCRTRHPEQYR